MLSEDFFEQIPFGLYRSTPDGHIECANRALAELMGYQSAEHLLSTNSRHFYKDLKDREDWQEKVEAARGRFVEYMTTWRRADNKLVRIRNTGRCVRVDNQVVAYEGIILDVSQLPQVAAPRRSQDSLDAILDSLPICVSRKDRNRKVTWANKTFCRLEHITLEELVGKRYSDELLYDVEMGERYRQSDEHVLATREPKSFIEPHRFGDGTICNVQVIKVPLFASDGSTVDGIEIYFWDVKLDHAKEEMERETRYSQLLNSPLTAVYEHDLRGKYTYANDAAVQLVGRRPEEFLRLNMTDLVAPEFVDFAKARIEELTKRKNPNEGVLTYEIELLGADGRRIPVEVTSRVIMKNERPFGIIGYARDLTHRSEAEQRRLSEVHHRVKNNLHTINVLLDRERLALDNQDFASVISDCQARVLAIADLHEQLYRANRVDHIAVADYVRNLAQKLVRTYSQSWQKITPRVTVNSELFLSLDAMIPVALVLQELISNSMKHAFHRRDREDRYGSIMVTLSQSGEPGRYQLQVTDTGKGMPSGFDPRKSRTLGMKLLFGLIERQLKGSVQFGTAITGTSFTAQFFDPAPVTKRSSDS